MKPERYRRFLTVMFSLAALAAWAVSHDAARRKAQQAQRRHGRGSVMGRIAVEDMRRARAASQRSAQDIIDDILGSEGE